MIGLLQCDHVRDEFRHIGGDYDEMFRRWLPAQWRVYDVVSSEAPESIYECSAYVATGSRASVYEDEPWIHRFAALVRAIHSANAPMLGVCFGHQMIAHALGGRVTKCPRGWGIGIHQFRVSRREEWMRPPLDSYSLPMACQDQVDELPAGAVVLAGNAHCPIGMYRVGSLLGVQGHPEFSPAYAEALMRYRTDLIGTERVEAAAATLTDPVHASEFAAWARGFLLPAADVSGA